jgi:hypothetical protein
MPSEDPRDECECGDYRWQHHDLGCTVCMHGTPPPDGPDGCRRFRLGFRVGERDAMAARPSLWMEP